VPRPVAIVSLTLVVVALGLLGAGCGLLRPEEREPSAAEIVARAAEAIERVETVHFRLEVAGGTAEIVTGLQMTSAEGDVARPDRLRMQVNARAANVPVQVELVAIGERRWLTNPLTKRWTALPGQFALAPVLDPERGVANLIRRLSGLVKLPNETLDGQAVYHLRGTAAAADLAALAGAQGGGGSVAAEAWIGVQDFLPRQVRIEGAVVSGEPAGLVRVLKLSGFNAPVSIEPPL
jgi:hypothetical protein